MIFIPLRDKPKMHASRNFYRKVMKTVWVIVKNNFFWFFKSFFVFCVNFCLQNILGSCRLNEET